MKQNLFKPFETDYVKQVHDDLILLKIIKDNKLISETKINKRIKEIENLDVENLNWNREYIGLLIIQDWLKK